MATPANLTALTEGWVVRHAHALSPPLAYCAVTVATICVSSNALWLGVDPLEPQPEVDTLPEDCDMAWNTRRESVSLPAFGSIHGVVSHLGRDVGEGFR